MSDQHVKRKVFEEKERRLDEITIGKQGHYLDDGELKAALEKAMEATNLDERKITEVARSLGDDIPEVLNTRTVHYVQLRALLRLFELIQPRIVS